MAEEKSKTKRSTTKKITTKKTTRKKTTKKTTKKNIEKSQPTMNIGLVGHVDHGKTTLTEKLTGKWTDTHSEESKRGITIRLGYANTVIYQCSTKKDYTISKVCDGDSSKPIRKVSFVDAPGHESLMATMLGGAAIMDYAILLIAANEQCPQPQTKEHLMALEIMNIPKIIVLQNKIDLMSKEEIIKNYHNIRDFLHGTPYEKSPIVPISAKYGINVDKVMELITTYFKEPKRNIKADTIMYIARSFDINKPGTKVESLKGGILGGSIKEGTLKVGDTIEILPGFPEEVNGKKIRVPITTKIVGLKTDKQDLDQAYPGGSIALQTTLDPAIAKSDQLTGNVVGAVGKMPPIRQKLKLETHLFKTIISNDNEDINVDDIKMNEIIMINVYSAASVGVVTNLKKKFVELTLKIPVAAAKDARVSLSRRVGSRFRLIGYGIIVD